MLKNGAQYHFTKKANINIESSNRIATTIIKSFFGKVLSSTPLFRVSSNRVIVQLFYYNYKTGLSATDKISPFCFVAPQQGTTYTNKALDTLGIVLSRLYPNMTLELRFMRLQQPYLNSNILAQYLAINASKYNFNRLQNILLSAVHIIKRNALAIDTVQERSQPMRLVTGVKVQLSGLLTTQRAAPRKTVYTASAGTFSVEGVRTSANSPIVDYSSSTSKSRDGAFNIKV